MTKISRTHHRTKNGKIKKNPSFLRKEVKELIKIRDLIPRGDLQGIAESIAMQISPTDWQTQRFISDDILVIVDNAHNFNEKQLNHHIDRLDEDIKKWLDE